MAAAASVAWCLHRDLGFPLDLVDIMLEEKDVQVDREELNRLMEESQKVRPHTVMVPGCPSDDLSLR